MAHGHTYWGTKAVRHGNKPVGSISDPQALLYKCPLHKLVLFTNILITSLGFLKLSVIGIQ
jgi:hypothetical protein